MFATDFTPSSRNREPGHTFGTVELQTLIDNIFETMRSGRGIGLAAPQIGVSERIIVFEFAVGSHARVRRPFRQRALRL
jgi:peptide deformylase